MTEAEDLQNIAVDYSVAIDQTTIHPIGMAVLAASIIGIVVLPRRYAAVPLLLITCFIPTGQRIAVGGLDFTLQRIVILAGLMRISFRDGFERFRPNALDAAMAAWTVVLTLAYVIQQGSFSAFVTRLGASIDLLGAYLLVRLLIRSPGDLRILLLTHAVMVVPLAVVMGIEKMTMRNFFSVLGGVPDITLVRHGEIRAQGAFTHPILAGTFGASVFAMLLGIVLAPGARRFGLGISLVASLLVVFFSASSGPLVSLAAALLGWGFWFARGYLRLINLILLALLATIQIFFMSHPFWHLFVRLNFVSGSTGYHRYALIDSAVERIGEWYLVGVRNTAHWGHNLEDVTNQFVLQGVRGGLLTLVLFVAALWVAFHYVGNAERRLGAFRGGTAASRRSVQLLFWGVGASLFCHVISMFGASYWGQLEIVFVMNLAFAALAENCTRPLVARRRAPVPLPAREPAEVVPGALALRGVSSPRPTPRD